MKPEELKDLVKEQFASDYAIKFYSEYVSKGLWESEEYFINKYFRKGLKILDLGCGAGRTTFAFIKKGFNVIGVDIVPEMIKAAKTIAKTKKVKAELRVGDATKLNFKDNYFDIVFFSNNGWTMIPHSNLRKMALEEIKRVLKPNGLYIFTSHQRVYRGSLKWFWIKQWIKINILKHLGIRVDELEFGDRFFESESCSNEGKYPEKQYIHIFKKNEVVKELQKVGFNIVETGTGNKKEPEGIYPAPLFYVANKENKGRSKD